MKFNKHIRNLIADFRSLPRENVQSNLRRPKSVGSIVNNALDGLTIKHRGERVLLENWEFIVGEKFSNRCRPITVLKNDVLLINCSNSIIRSELEIVKLEIFQKITSISQCSHIRDIRFNISNN